VAPIAWAASSTTASLWWLAISVMAYHHKLAVVVVGNFRNGLHISGLAEQMHRYNRSRLWRDFPFDAGRVNIIEVRLNINKDRSGS